MKHLYWASNLNNSARLFARLRRGYSACNKQFDVKWLTLSMEEVSCPRCIEMEAKRTTPNQPEAGDKQVQG
jgi:hypothetical protein